MDLKSLPDIEFAKKDINSILNDMINEYEQAYYAQTGKQMTLYPGDKIRIFLYSQALREFQLRELIDFSAKQNLLKYSLGEYLDNLGASQNVERSGPSYSTVSEKFILSAPQPKILVIPKGTRCTAEVSNIYFATTDDIEIPANTTEIETILTCMTPGKSGNEFTPGQINILSDPLPFVSSVINIDTSQGGTEKEDDDTLREKIREAPEGYSVAGPEGAYEFFIKEFNSSITGIKIDSTVPGNVDIKILLGDGEIPNDTFIQQLYEYLSNKTRRPLTDHVNISAPEIVNYDIDMKYYISSDNAESVSTIQSSVNQAIQDYILWQKSQIGRDVNPSELTLRIMTAGAKRVEINTPVYTQISSSQVAISSNVNVVYGGIEDD